MRTAQVSIPEIGLIAGTRAMLGAGLGLLLAERMSESQRRAIGWTLFFVGLFTTIPLVLEVRSHLKPEEESRPKAEREAPWAETIVPSLP
jgi:hypothetical protein